MSAHFANEAVQDHKFMKTILDFDDIQHCIEKPESRFNLYINAKATVSFEDNSNLPLEDDLQLVLSSCATVDYLLNYVRPLDDLSFSNVNEVFLHGTDHSTQDVSPTTPSPDTLTPSTSITKPPTWAPTVWSTNNDIISQSPNYVKDPSSAPTPQPTIWPTDNDILSQGPNYVKDPSSAPTPQPTIWSTNNDISYGPNYVNNNPSSAPTAQPTTTDSNYFVNESDSSASRARGVLRSVTDLTLILVPSLLATTGAFGLIID